MRATLRNPERVREHFARTARAWRASLERMDEVPQARYRVALHRAKGCYFARVLELPGCIARGDSEVEAVENARHAIRFHLWMAHVLAGERASVEVEIRA